MARLGDSEIDERLATSQWRREGDSIVRDIECTGFVSAMALVTPAMTSPKMVRAIMSSMIDAPRRRVEDEFLVSMGAPSERSAYVGRDASDRLRAR